MKYIPAIVGTFLMLGSCQNEDISLADESSDYILFGHFHGFCSGEQCVEIYKLTDANLFEDTLDLYPARDAGYEGRFTPLGNTLFLQVEDLRSKIPAQLLSTPSGVIGAPDVADGGGIYFETRVNGEKKYWLIDKMRMNIPDYLNAFVDAIESKIQIIP